MPWLYNPHRRLTQKWSRRARIRAVVQRPFIAFGVWLGFKHVDHAYIHGGHLARIHIGNGCSTMDAIMNVASGTITIGDGTVLGHGCALLTGEHRFSRGQLVGLLTGGPYPEIPTEGNDITIGRGCFLASGAMVLKGVTIGDNVIVGAGAIVTRDLPSGCFAAGIPAKVIRLHHDKRG